MIVLEWGRLNEEHNRSLVDAASQELKSKATDSPSVASTNYKIRKGKGKADSEFFISPMPPLTPLPTSLEDIIAPPDNNDRIAQEPANSRPLLVSCGKQHCPFDCDCAPVPVFPRSPSLSPSQAPRHTAPSPTSYRTPHISEPEMRISPPEAHSPIRDSEPTPTPIRSVHRTPGGLSLTAPTADVDRNSNRSQSFTGPSPSTLSGCIPTRPSSPVRTPNRNTTSLDSLRSDSKNYNVPQEHLRSRLHDILSSPTTSTSLPNLSGGHFPATPKSNSIDPRRDPLPALHSTSSASSVPQSQTSSRPIPIRGSVDPSSQPVNVNVNAPAPGSSASSLTSRSGISHASSAALALEQAQKELRRAEKERQREERERQRTQQIINSSQDPEVSGTSSSVPRPAVSRSSSRRDYGNSTSSSSSLPRDSSVSSAAAAATRPHAVYISSGLKPSSTSHISSAYATQQNLARYPSTTSTKSKVSTAMTGNGNVGLYA